MTRGGGRVSVGRSVQAVSGFAIRQRPRVGSRAVIPSTRLSARSCPMTRLCGPSIVGTASCLIHIEAAVLDRLTAMWRRGENYSDASPARRDKGASIRSLAEKGLNATRDIASLVTFIIVIVAPLGGALAPWLRSPSRSTARSGAASSPARGSEFASSQRAENIKISRRRTSHRMTLHQNRRLASKRAQSPDKSCWIAAQAKPEAR
jgi:hypothetical protein